MTAVGMAEQDPVLDAMILRDQDRDRLLLAMLPDVAFDGWTWKAAERGGRSIGMPPAQAQALFPGGTGDMVAWLWDWADRQMLAAVNADDLAAMKGRDRVATVAWAWFQALAPHDEALRRALAILAMPNHWAAGPRLLYGTVDTIWRLAGNTATDHNFYTKRGLLAGAFAATLSYWLVDGSDGRCHSRAFLDRRLDDAMRLGRGAASTLTALLNPAGGLGLRALLPSPARFLRHARRGHDAA